MFLKRIFFVLTSNIVTHFRRLMSYFLLTETEHLFYNTIIIIICNNVPDDLIIYLIINQLRTFPRDIPVL